MGDHGVMSPALDPNGTHADAFDPSGVPFAQLNPEVIRQQRTSIKWTRFPADVLPLFVAEMDFALAPEIQQRLIERVQASDTGYLEAPGPLAPAFANFAHDRWGWQLREDFIHLATDVATGIVEAFRAWGAWRGTGPSGRLLLPTPVYPGFFEMLQELPFETVQVPLVEERSGREIVGRLDFDAIEREFASEAGIDAFLLSNPHNPHGIAFAEADLRRLAVLAAKHDVFVISDEIHAPLTHRDAVFSPFAPLAAEAGALAVITTSASKGWNLAGTKCSVVIAADERANEVLSHLAPEVTVRSSILGLHASVAAFTDARDWLDRVIARVESNEQLLVELIEEHLPGVRVARPQAGYLVWLDLREAGLGDRPAKRILHEARVALNDGAAFGEGGDGHARINLACAPDTLREAVRRIASILPAERSQLDAS